MAGAAHGPMAEVVEHGWTTEAEEEAGPMTEVGEEAGSTTGGEAAPGRTEAGDKVLRVRVQAPPAVPSRAVDLLPAAERHPVVDLLPAVDRLREEERAPVVRFPVKVGFPALDQARFPVHNRLPVGTET
jgi:hypothetical protein